jgi:pimeloyl-ACP methyl ester carboxylesterase
LTVEACRTWIRPLRLSLLLALASGCAHQAQGPLVAHPEPALLQPPLPAAPREFTLTTTQNGMQLGQERVVDDGHVLTSHMRFVGSDEVVITIDRQRRQVSLQQGGQTETLPIPAGTLAVENFHWAAYAIVAEEYAQATQPTAVKLLIPSRKKTADGTVQVTARAAGGHHVTVAIGPVTLEADVDADGHVVDASVPGQGIAASSAAMPAAAATTTSRLPTPPSIIETPLTITTHDGLTLRGVWSRPANATGPIPALIIIGGSGPVDRDGNVKPIMAADSYRLLSFALAEHGIATVRYDKRGAGASDRPPDLAKTSFDDFVRDAASVVHEARQNRALSKVYVLGHSEGGLVALMLAARQPLDGLILASAAGRPIVDVLREQLGRQVSPAAMSEYEALIAADKSGQTLAAHEPILQQIFRPQLALFRRQWLFADPVALQKALKLPTLVVQGDHDLQVTVDDARRLANARPGVRLAILPNVSHVLKVDEGTSLPQASYSDVTRPIAPALVDAVVALVKP